MRKRGRVCAHMTLVFQILSQKIAMSEIEERIRDTTHLVEEPQDHAPEILLCACGSEPISTHGAAAFMRKCDTCFTEISKQLDDELNAESDRDDYATIVEADVVEEAGEMLNTDEASLESLEGSLIMAMSDSSKSCEVQLNGVRETFIFNFDPINHSKARKIFKRKSWDDMFRDLYWYLPFGAIITTTNSIVTPCVAQWKASSRSGPVVLYAILETMCNRPRYDSFCIDLDKRDVFIVQNFLSKVSGLDLNLRFDRAECDK